MANSRKRRPRRLYRRKNDRFGRGLFGPRVFSPTAFSFVLVNASRPFLAFTCAYVLCSNPDAPQLYFIVCNIVVPKRESSVRQTDTAVEDYDSESGDIVHVNEFTGEWRAKRVVEEEVVS